MSPLHPQFDRVEREVRFDDTELGRYAGLTTATHPVEAIAEAATRAVLDARATRPPDMYFPSHLVARQTA